VEFSLLILDSDSSEVDGETEGKTVGRVYSRKGGQWTQGLNPGLWWGDINCSKK
jgi:hypothetical protein